MSFFTVLLLLFLLAYLPSSALNQPDLPSNPTITQCGSRLLALASCAPFVQGVSTTPTQLCCDNLRQVNNQQPRCLCLLLNNTALNTNFPVNTTLVMQLPLICNVHVDVSSCSGAPLPSVSPTPQVSLGSTNNSTVASSPMTTITPRSGFMGLGFHQNYAIKLDGSLHMLMVVVLAIVACISTNTLHPLYITWI